jgi:DNA-binding MarR family transcriptional regulator
MMITKEDHIRLAALRSAIRQFLRFSEVQARGAGITPQQHQMLLTIRGMPDRDWATVGELADHLQINHNAAVGLAQRAEAVGLVERTAHPEDRRVVCVAVTPKGEAILSALSADHKRELERLAPALTALLSQITEESINRR